MTETRFLLSSINNPNAPMRANGIRWWGYPSRTDRPRVIVLHTAETVPSGSSARAVASWQSQAPVPSSYHVLCDSQTTLRTVRDDHTAFHAAGFNSISLGVSWATRATLWGTYPDWDERALSRAAAVCRRWQDVYGIPPTMLTRPQVQAGASGYVRHSTLDPARRSDPGLKFPAERFFALVDDGDDMPLTDDDVDRIALAVWRRRNNESGSTYGYMVRRMFQGVDPRVESVDGNSWSWRYTLERVWHRLTAVHTTVNQLDTVSLSDAEVAAIAAELAAAMDDRTAAAVADELAKRLAG